MIDQHLQLPEGVRAVSGPKGLRLLGKAIPLIETCTRLREIGELRDGDFATVDNWYLHVSSTEPEERHRGTITYSSEAWRVAAGVLIEVPSGGYRSPLDFGDVRFCERSEPDIGVSLLGVTRYDLGRHPSRAVELREPDNLVAVEEAYAEKGMGVLLRRDDLIDIASWTIDLVSLATGEIMDERHAVGMSMEAAVDDLAP
jgi:hypothetical protein